MTSHILMIEPVAFGFNEETAANNYFQKKDGQSLSTIQKKAHREFTDMVAKLRAIGVNIVTVVDTAQPHTPDSIFPNNWVSFHSDGRVALYPMFAPNRRLERRMDILADLTKVGFEINQMVDYSNKETEGYYLEGTGSMILDRNAGIAYAALSERTDEGLFLEFCADFGYTPCVFHAYQSVDEKRLPIYHTNVMMCVADKYALVCFDAIDDGKEKMMVMATLLNSGKELIVALTQEQIHHFAGNMLQVESADNIPYLILSQSAYDALSNQQRQQLSAYNMLVPIDISTIEQYGGGSARCMMAEIYNPINQK